MIRSFLDSGVLLTAWRGEADAAAAAIAIMEDPDRQFCTSAILKLELRPKAHYHRQREELAFYDAHFSRAKKVAHLTPELERTAGTLAQKYGLSAADALNVAAALLLEADEFVTSELPGKPLFRVKEITVRSMAAVR